tara:strand:- start:270 stop:644 length:375 start_codon:yes stop_codon:yes gene_type:complete
MSVVAIYNGMEGKSDAKVRIPNANMSVEMLTNRDPQIGRVKYEKAPNILNNAINYSTARGVLPCIGITTHVLRAPAGNPANAYQVAQGFGSNQPRGLASGDYINDYPVLRPFSSIHMNQPSSLG